MNKNDFEQEKMWRFCFWLFCRSAFIWYHTTILFLCVCV